MKDIDKAIQITEEELTSLKRAKAIMERQKPRSISLIDGTGRTAGTGWDHSSYPPHYGHGIIGVDPGGESNTGFHGGIGTACKIHSPPDRDPTEASPNEEPFVGQREVEAADLPRSEVYCTGRFGT